MRNLIAPFFFFLILISAAFSAACEKPPVENAANLSQPSPQPSATIKKVSADLPIAMKSVEPFFKRMGKPQPDEWLASNNESGQTFDEYINGNPTVPTVERKTIYVQPLGEINPQQQKIISATAEYMRLFFNLPVKILPVKKYEQPMPLQGYRIHPQFKVRQIRTGYVLTKILIPNLPADAAALIAFTEQDLYPTANMNYVFGQASLEHRVGVWSLNRLDNLTGAQNFLKRTLKIAVHETGHIFSMRHCTKYECVMSGTNHLGETDKHPVDACPECMAKICWFADYRPSARYQNLAEFCKKNGLEKEELEFRKKAAAVKGK